VRRPGWPTCGRVERNPDDILADECSLDRHPTELREDRQPQAGVDDKQVALAFRKLPVGALERLLEKVGVITPEKFIAEWTIWRLHLDIDVAASF
jgi:hypothetical protein